MNESQMEQAWRVTALRNEHLSYENMKLEERAAGFASLLREALPELKESIDAIGDDHSVGICCCNLISLVDRINSALSGVPIYTEQDEPDEVTA